MAFSQYDPLKVTCTVSGVPIRGWADGEMIVVEDTVDKRSKHIGTGGEGRHIKSADKSGTITIRLADYSPSNAVLLAVDEVDEPVTITVTDKSMNADLFAADSCTLVKVPNMTKGAETSINEWAFQYITRKLIHSGAEEV
jgi:hypothetical protein